MDPARIEAKQSALFERLSRLSSVAVAYSGGVDSAYLLYAAHRVLNERCVGVIADSPSLPRRDLEEALDLARQRQWPVRVIQTRELENPDYASNPMNRCYFCKKELFSVLREQCARMGISDIVYGENGDDARDFRPGRQAALEYNILALLKDVGLTKQEIRALSRRAGLPTAEKPAQPCLASRLPTGQSVTREKLRQIEMGERYLSEAGFNVYRLRHRGDVARIQVAPNELSRLKNPDLQSLLAQRLQNLGFSEVEFDWEGYRGPSLPRQE
jgi:uncharacterized protein